MSHTIRLDSPTSERATYYVATYIPDPLRNEPRNVGVIVERGGERSAMFFGEEEPEAPVDGRRLKWHANVGIYRQWVHYWRHLMRTLGPLEQHVTPDATGNYQLRLGGTVERTEDDSLRAVTWYLYHMIVGDGPLEAYERTPESTTVILEEEVDAELGSQGLLVSGDKSVADVPHPILRREKLASQSSGAPHTPRYSQRNGALWVMEPIDFTRTQKAVSRDHAAFSAFMFGDILRDGLDVRPIALVKMTDEDAAQDPVRHGLGALREADALIVNWLVPDDRAAFIEERRRVAFSG